MHDALEQRRGQEGADSIEQLDETAPQLHKRHKRNQEYVAQMYACAHAREQLSIRAGAQISMGMRK